MRIGQKLIFGFVGIALLVGVVGYLAITSLREIDADVHEIRESTTDEIKAATNMAFELARINILIREYMLEKIENRPDEIAKAKKELEESFENFEKAFELGNSAIKAGIKLAENKEEKEEERKEIEKLKSIEGKYKIYKKNLMKTIAICEKQGYDAADEFYESEIEEKGIALLTDVRWFEKDAEDEITSETEEVCVVIHSVIRLISVVTAFALFLAVGVGLLIARLISTPITKLRDVAIDIGKGDLSKRAEVKSKDEIGELATAFNQMAEEILKARAYAEGLISSMADGLWVADLKGATIDVNTQMEKMLGYKKGGILGRTPPEFFVKKDKPRVIAGMKECAEKGFLRNWEGTLVAKDGKEIPVLLNTTLLKDSQGKPMAVYAIFRDITEIKKAQEELQTANEELRSTNEELETSNEELQSTTEELETSNEELRTTQEELVQKEKLAAVGQLASGVGHELRNPLGVIKNATYFIKTKVGTEDPKLVKHINIMEREINNSNKIISDLLGFSRTRPPAIAPSDMNKVVEDTLEVVEIPENIKLVKELGADLPNAMVDPDQIQQVFVNLALNAVQAMSEGGQLKIATRKKDDFIETEFSDTGCGISEENLKKLFDPFFTTKARGIGLGLAVSQGIIEKHKGVIDVKSEVEKGTTFVVKLPVEKKEG